ncbi:MAG: hypothetical protein A3A28_02215 [Candidatus Sungbacteria bacterium RIFCSPLOWO2_01_FULL_47_32]|uniref:Cation-transporting P-type ATPase N-terminal domain-containing protein n=1 Tax=Candidatus Sungbacteria bacterium RIFCSPHIGHO2_01_FULL_47_32 TaxID=1802264 RepID=A0A1G2K7N4_9BACT|nr:MAG: Calcium-translocating P-type ATPase, PMCA-type [Parcubacteria group bacterium GW2011_GWA2_47_10]OGZ95427.1 MAG: hypothetical protein A2633_05895 [Candidatus Sungbacteria bacterium RIFCSPHIGHO2_01_FULL_47_32]OHA06283.1 MAG: hypothetical protein A3A28_02215 [Candidatus Sungbacteria bacterium RIFCSPLOWO2_01_FULL_47_32]
MKIDLKEKILWHAESVDFVLKKLKTGERGLEPEEAARRLLEFGKNSFGYGTERTLFRIFLGQFKNPFVAILVAAGVISFFLSDVSDAAIIMFAILINVVLGCYQEGKAEKAFHSLRMALEEFAYCIRGGKELCIRRENVVPGDIIVFRPGEKVPADVRIIESRDLILDESVLTGEALGASKKPGELPETASVFMRTNMAFAGTVVFSGRGTGVAVETGSCTEFGRITSLVSAKTEEPTPIQNELKKISFVLTAVTLGIVSVVFLFGTFFHELPLFQMFLVSVALAVSAIPEGLAISVTIVLAVGMQRIFRKKALVRNLFAAQTLGSVSLIATDKTGTLTKGEMRVSSLLTGVGELLHEGKRYDKSFLGEKENSHNLLLKIALLLSEAEIENPEAALEELVIHGNPTERALVLAAYEAGFRRETIVKEYPRRDFLPFDSGHKFSLAIHSDEEEKKNLLFALGAPEIVMKGTASIMLDGKTERFTEIRRKELVEEVNSLAGRGLRVIAAAYRPVEEGLIGSEPIASFQDLIFVGLIIIHDPLRADAKEAVQVAYGAGVRPVLITGDHRLTAEAIAREVGIIRDGAEGRVADGIELDLVTEKDFEREVSDIDVYARVTPEQKLRIIEAWKKKGAVVAMTGDGVNDAPALKHADIGIALGSGTDLAKEAADIVLLDNSFAGVVAAIREGRVIFENIRKILIFLFSGAFAEVILVGTSVFFGLPLPLLPGQILWINLIGDSLPNIAMVFEGGDGAIATERPEAFRALFTRKMFFFTALFVVVRMAFVISVFFYLLYAGSSIGYIRTMMFVFLGIDAQFYIFGMRNFHKPFWIVSLEDNPYLLPSAIIGTVFMVCAVYLPILSKTLDTVSLGIADWGLVALYGASALFVLEILKFSFFKRRA